MIDGLPDIALIAALMVIVILAAVAFWLHWKLFQLRKQQAEARLQAQIRREEQRRGIIQSVQIIARALEAEQVGATEASIRISVLLDAADVSQAIKQDYAAFYKLAEEAAHIPILDSWKALPKHERKAYEKELVALEEKYRDFVIDASRRIQLAQL